MIKSNDTIYKLQISFDGLEYVKKTIDSKISCFNIDKNGQSHLNRCNFIAIYDLLTNNSNIIDLCVYDRPNRFDNSTVYCGYYDERNRKLVAHELEYKSGITNKFIKEFYDNCDWDINNRELTYKNIINNILNYNLINILIKNICKEFYVKYIDIYLLDKHIRIHGVNKLCLIIDTITIIIDETKPSNNRKIKIYKEFNEFYQNRDKTKNYQIIKDIHNLCIIEELDDTNIIDKDAEIDKLKKENEMLKKFYIC